MARINEIGDTEKGQYMLGRLRARKFKKDGFQKGNEIGKYAEKTRENATQKIKNVDGVDHMVYSPYKYDKLTNAHANGWHDEMRKDENRNMKQQLKLNESELYSIIEGAVKSLVMEYLPYEGGKVAARRLQQGDTGAFEKYMGYGLDNGWTNDDMSDFQSGIEAGSSVVEDEDFEDLNDGPINNAVDGSLEDDIAFESKRAVKVNESQLFDIIKESVSKILTELDWKTYMNAARARQAQGNGDKASNLEAYANNQFNRQHFGDRNYYLSHEDVSQGNDLSVSAGLTANANMNGGYMKDERDYTSPMYGATMQTPWGNYREKIGRNNLAGGTVYHGFGKDYVKNDTGYAMKKKGGGGDHSQMLNRVNTDYKNKINSVGNDLDGYYNNKSKYVKGQGWQ